ncbi:MAG: tRNA preQ1(34) S-adenosylmethionine ribosyltransferase-isomerase QueA [Thermogutta sp.]|nr:tRNA preQ1(34) S-adenosylmethionine ribosyltransferase-isomerase QueA [Thermogutta sp.]HOP77510.1 tRNA preQ1(34) S-adenosylmethionine ribosyltransferase-isomerase QueA [Thermogutta sp.]HPU06874.1 tRNA preQ1(34) S-adenosylmethionine ribosyltransferase-isomerase QueA [Thermogutta sp.]HPZ82891.1 tRNA preQ1(34) S-adenosylmethionine ribosyltransferase-isomerase QueA [Thermogutta sp.]HQF13272.1 tRNA preQ1(34) S-adenosylmethionine ribosyltransferase-isomerase QueA [Thermogutta sp.]
MLDTDCYDYELPKHLIAQSPLPNRADARLMVVNRATGEIEHRHVRDLPELLRPGDALVLNNTKVVPARLVGYRTATGGRWEGLFVEADASGVWHVIGKTRGKLQPGESITLVNLQGRDDIRLFVIGRIAEGGWLVSPDTAEDSWEVLNRVGRVPLPPYIRGGQMLEEDRNRYQTVYAEVPGSVAAPTAGLHFTQGLLRKLKEAGIEICYLTLHVGLGTFVPIKTSRIEEHRMHAEWGTISEEVVERLKQIRSSGGRIVAVGTTVTRLLETAALDGELKAFSGRTDLFIRPPYQFRAVDVLMTNFHLPRTTLLVLVRTFGGDNLIKRAYEEAIRESYRFYSYGDAMLIF